MLNLKQGLEKIKSLNSSFFVNSGSLILSSFASQAINFLFYPILTRSISPESFGLFAILVSFVSVFSIFAFGRLELLLPKFQSKLERQDLFKACLLFFLFVLLMAFIVVHFFSDYLFQISNIKEIEFWAISVFVTFATTSFTNLLSSYLVALNSYKTLTISRILQPVIVISSTFLAAQFFTGYIALFMGLNVANAVSILIALFQIFITKKEWVSQFHILTCFSIYKENKKMILVNSPHAIIDSVQTNFMNFSMGKFYGMSSLGQYAMANRLVRSPMNIISSSIGQVFYGDIYKYLNDPPKLKAFVTQVLVVLTLLAFAVSAAVWLFAQYFYLAIFGEKWSESASLVVALIPWMLANFVSSPLSQITIMKEKQLEAMLFGLFYNLLIWLSLHFLGVFQFSFIHNILITSLLACALNVVYVIFIFKLLNQPHINRNVES